MLAVLPTMHDDIRMEPSFEKGGTRLPFCRLLGFTHLLEGVGQRKEHMTGQCKKNGRGWQNQAAGGTGKLWWRPGKMEKILCPEGARITIDLVWC